MYNTYNTILGILSWFNIPYNLALNQSLTIFIDDLDHNNKSEISSILSLSDKLFDFNIFTMLFVSLE